MFNDDELEDYEDEPLPADLNYVDKAARRLVRPEWIGHPPWKVPSLSKSQLKELAKVCLAIHEREQSAELKQWLRSRMSEEAISRGKLEPIGARIYSLLMLTVVLADAGIEPFASSRITKSTNSVRSDYLGPPAICEATGVDPVQCTVPSDDPDRPYRLSYAAADRLEYRCLSPMEWYRLAVHHGRNHYYLWPDFYGNDGTPFQAMFPVKRARGERVPNFEDVRDNLGRLLDFTFFNLQLDRRFEEKADVVAALASFGRPAVEAELDARAKRQPVALIKSLCWRIRIELGFVDEHQLRARWAGVTASIELSKMEIAELARQSIPIIGVAATIDLVLTAADQLGKLPAPSTDRPFISPFSVAFSLRNHMGAHMLLELVVALMERVPADQTNSEMFHAFTEFRDERVVDWIEQHVSEPVDTRFGAVAAVNGMSWGRVTKWLRTGRPLSLVALDAMKNCREFDPQTMSGIFKDFSPKIADDPKHEDIKRELLEYAKRDSDKRVTDATEVIFAHLDKIF